MSAQNAEVVEALNELRLGQSQLLATLQSLSKNAGLAPGSSTSATGSQGDGLDEALKAVKNMGEEESAITPSDDVVLRSQFGEDAGLQALSSPSAASPSQKSTLTSRIILTYVGCTCRTLLPCPYSFRLFVSIF